MSDTPVVPVPVNSFQKELSWIQKHERILIVALVLLTGAWLGTSWIDYAAKNADAHAVAIAQQLQDQKAANVQLATTTHNAAAIYQDTISALTQQNSQLAAAVATRNAALGKQQTADKALPLSGLALRWASIAGVPPSDITASATGIAITDSGARQTVLELEKVPVLTANLADETVTAGNRQTQINKANDLIDHLGIQVTGLQTQIVDQDKACKAEVTAVKADARKGKVRWFKAGVVVGFVAGLFAGKKLP